VWPINCFAHSFQLLNSTSGSHTRPLDTQHNLSLVTGYDTVVDRIKFTVSFRWLVFIELLFGMKMATIGKKTKTRVRSWRLGVRDAFVASLARYMALDPFERIWAARPSSVDDDDDTDFQRWSPSYSTLAYPSNRATNADANARLCSTFPVSTTNNPWSIIARSMPAYVPM
jgi:hypothetical protein